MEPPRQPRDFDLGRRAGGGARPFAPSSTDARPTIASMNWFFDDRAVTSRAATRPSRSTVARSVISSTSSTSCETKITLAPSATTVRTTSNNWSTSRRGRNGVGSSRTSRPLPEPPPLSHFVGRADDGEQRALHGRKIRKLRVGIDRQAIGLETRRGLAPLAAASRSRSTARRAGGRSACSRAP